MAKEGISERVTHIFNKMKSMGLISIPPSNSGNYTNMYYNMINAILHVIQVRYEKIDNHKIVKPILL